MAKKTRKTKARARTSAGPRTLNDAKPSRRGVKALPRKPAPSRDDELDRLDREERALVRDADNEAAPSAMADSPEYIPEAMEDSLAEELGEATVESATSGDQANEAIRNQDVPEDVGGPFVRSTARQEFARGTDASNPEDAEPAEFPTANRLKRK
jgi:hypothetical protein